MNEQLRKLKGRCVFLAKGSELSSILDINGNPIFEGNGKADVVCIACKNGYNYFVTNDWKNFFGKSAKIAPGKAFSCINPMDYAE
jgi:hypothetical protein